MSHANQYVSYCVLTIRSIPSLTFGNVRPPGAGLLKSFPTDKIVETTIFRNIHVKIILALSPLGTFEGNCKIKDISKTICLQYLWYL